MKENLLKAMVVLAILAILATSLAACDFAAEAEAEAQSPGAAEAELEAEGADAEEAGQEPDMMDPYPRDE